MRIHSFDDITRTVGPAALDKAARYQRQRRATVTHMADDGTLIEGRVQGTQRRPYVVTVEVAIGGDGRAAIEGTCSCPVGFNCKHVAALLIESMATPAGRKLAAVAGGAVLSPQAESWLGELDRALALSEEDYPPTIRQRLIYVLSIDDGAAGPPEAMLELQSVRLRKDDTFSERTSRYDPQSAFSSTPAKFVRGDDMPILRRLLHLRGPYVYGAGSHVLHGETGAEVLDLAVATGRCRWQAPDGPVMRRGEPRAGSIAWGLQEDGSQKPRVSVEGCGTAIGVIPPWYIDADAALCGRLELGVPPRVAAMLLLAPPIEPQLVPAMRSRLAERLPGRSELLPTEPSPPETITGPPAPVLQLVRCPVKPGVDGYFGGSSADRAGARSLRVARPAFAYGPTVIAGHDPRGQPLFAKDGRLFTIRRDRRLEGDLRRRLIADDTRLIAVPPHLASAFSLDVRGDLVLGGDEDIMAWPGFLVEVVPRLRAEGWRVEIEPGFMPPLAEVDGDIDAALQQGSGIDWFEFDVGVPVDGRRINLLPHILDLLRATPSDADADYFDREDVHPQTLFLPLDDGRLLPLPFARVRPILSALYQLFQADLLTNGATLGFDRRRAAEVAALEELTTEAGIAWSGGEALRLLGKRLREAGGVGDREVPPDFAATLRPYQRQGYAWLRLLADAALGGVLADDMGLGKTVQALAHLLGEKVEGRADRPSLVVAPTSLMANWRREAERLAPTLRVLTQHGADRKDRFGAVTEYDLVLTTFALLPRDRDVLLQQPWHVVIVDEAQNVKNPNTNAARVLRQLDARQRFCLTGTPVENHLGELWALMDFVNPGLLGDRQSFARTFRTPIEKRDDADRRQALARRVRPFMLRRTKAEVAGELPAKTEIVESIEMEADQRAIYEAVRLSMHRKVQDAIAAKGIERSRIIILDALLKLRQVCCDPRLLKLPAAKKSGARSAKLVRLMEMLAELVDEGRRVLLFSQFTSMLALIEARLTEAGIAFVEITGDVRDRETPVRRFQAGEVPVFLISLKAGGTGLNLTAADTVILYDPWWNPAVEAQAIDRSHRIGQEKPVFVHRLVTLGTIEEKMLALQQRKQALAAGLFDPEAGGSLDVTADDIDQLLAAG
jgi:Superfamily II DNA/RNA helicases, SNF2 family